MHSPGISTKHHERYPPFRRRRSGAHRYVLLCGASLVLAFCGTLLALRFVLRGSQERDLDLENDFSSENGPQTGLLESSRCEAVCYTKDCIKTAALIHDMLDPTVDPCEDFYSYACGGFTKTPTEHEERQNSLKGVQEYVTKFLQDTIKGIPKSVPEDTPGSSLTKIRNFYDSCMNPRSSEENILPTALKYLDHFGIKNWPDLYDDFSFSEPDLDEALIRLSMYDEFPLFEIRFVYIPLKNKTATWRINEEDVDNYDRKIMVYYNRYDFCHFGGMVEKHCVERIKRTLEYFMRNDTIVDEILADVLSLDLVFSNISEKASERNEECTTNGTECSAHHYDCDLERNQHLDRWCRIVKEILYRSGASKKYSSVPLVLEDEEHFRELGELIDSTHHRTLGHALALKFLKSHRIAMNFVLREEISMNRRYIDNKYIKEVNEYRSPFCAVWTSYRLPLLAGAAFYFNQYNNSKLRQEVDEMYSELKEISISSVKDIPWIDTEAKESLEQQFLQLKYSEENYLKFISNMTEIDKLHKEVQITEENFLANELESRKFAAILYLQNLSNFTEQEELQKFIFYFSPAYDDRSLTVALQLGTFLFPLVSADRPRYANLGYFGVVMGHEFGHPIEIFLRDYANKSEVFSNAYEERRKCIEDHFSEYEIDRIGEMVKGNKTFYENLADYLGVRFAFKALKKYEERHGTGNIMLPGLHFTNEQMLFLIIAQDWCETNTLASLKRYLKDNHSPANVRILGAYKNYDAFSEAFNCPVGSPMNPVTKCSFEN